jgi:fermentation-respiration switch protein FrsA (DUF1100 family)
MRINATIGRAAAIALLSCLPLFAQGKDIRPTGRWAGLFTGNGQSLEFELNFVEGGCLFSVPAQKLFGYPAYSVDFKGSDIEVVLFDQPLALLSGKMEDGAIRGVYTRDGQKASDFSLKPSALPGREGVDCVIDTGKGKLPGTLLLPDAKKFPGKVPVVLILADSGPVDRDGNNYGITGSNDCLALLALALRQAGLASLRYDKRGAGEAYALARSESDMTFEDYALDAVKAVLRLRTDGRFSKIVIIGHGQGSLVGSIAAARAKADAGVGLPAWKILQGQLEASSKSAGDASANAPLKGEWERIISELKAGRRVEKMSVELESVFRPSVQPYLISWFSFDPKLEIAKFKQPVLIILGGHDSRVGPDDAKALEAGRPDAKEAFIPDMNHVLKSTLPGDEADEESWSEPGYPLASGLQAVIGDFVKALE